MSYISFSQSQLRDVSFSSEREIIRTNRAGAYLASALNGMNTRKYHGLLVVPVDNFDGEKHVLLSALDETLIQRKTEYPLGARRYINNLYNPDGFKYLKEIHYRKVLEFHYKAGSTRLKKERLLVENEQQTLIKYTLEEATAPVTIRLQPFLAFRNIHALSHANAYALSGYEDVPNGVRVRLYDHYPWMYMQMSREAVFVPSPDWYYQVVYEKEQERGYDYLEDLFSPGYFEVELKASETLVFSAAVHQADVSRLKQRFYHEVRKRSDKNEFADLLRNAANQFIWHKESGDDIVAGFPWYDSLSRQTFISLPGLRLMHADRQLSMSVLDTYLPYLKNGLFPRSIAEPAPVYDNADASLWFIWCLHRLRKQGCRLKDMSTRYWDAVKMILEAFRQGTDTVNMLENGLLFSADQGRAYTWMDSYANGNPVVPRYGMPVELNALWYHAVRFALEIALHTGDEDFMANWRFLPEKIEEAFMKAFWDDKRGYLADVYNGFYTDWSVRPNMVIAAAMDYTPLSREQRHAILEIADRYLLTPRGLRTLSPEDPSYVPLVRGSHDERERAVHSGAVHPWLLKFYAKAYLEVHRRSGVAHIRSLIRGFGEVMSENCLGTISEYYDGDPPHLANGSLSHAWNVAAILSCNDLLSQVEKW